MSAIVQTALTNAVLVTAATPIVFVIGRMARRPVLSHSLWLILLFKLLTPPLWTFDLKLSLPTAAAVNLHSTVIAAEPVREIPQMAIVSTDVPRSDPVPPPMQEPSDALNFAAAAPAPALAPTPTRAPESIQPVSWWPLVAPILAATWVAGALLCLSVALIRVVRFSRALRWAIPASATVQARADALARSVGLDHSPIMEFIPGPLCPMLWPIGRSARLLVPCALWDRLDSIQRDTVLVHELAHWARRDHWVRWVELLATSLYWWLPACWMARKQLRRAEEQCCDAWVMWAVPGSFQHYANALLEAVEFVSMPADRPSGVTAVPALASGMGQFSDLKGRLTMLKNGNVSRALSLGGLTAVFGLGALLLPISPTIGQDAPQAAPANDQPPPGPAPLAERTVTVAPESTPPLATTDPRTSTRSESEAEALREIHRKSQQQIAELTRELQEAHAMIAALKARESAQANQRSADGPNADAAPANRKPYHRFFNQPGSQQAMPGAAPETFIPQGSSLPAAPSPDQRPAAPNGPLGGGAPGDVPYGQGELPAGVPIFPPDFQRQPRPVPSRARPARDPGERLDRLEVQLRMMLKEIDELKTERLTGRGPAAPPPPASTAAPAER